MSRLNVKEFRREDSTLKTAAFLSKNLDHLKEGDWQITLKISTGKPASVYISDILRVYTFIVDCNRSLTQTEIDQYVKANCISNRITSYVIPLIGTFSDIEISMGSKFAIRFIPLRETL